MELIIRQMTPEDWEQVSAIYLAGIKTGNATFETEVPTWERWNAAHLPGARLVACDGSVILGWVALSPFSSRAVYAGVAENSIYVHPDHHGKKVGSLLLAAMINLSERSGIWTLQTSIFPENQASLALHKNAGFREVGRRERISQLNGIWRDSILMERRSRVIGV